MEQQQENKQNQQIFKVRGMKTDLSESSFENSFAYCNKNMRINIVDEDNTLLNLTNEKGTKYYDSINGIVIGVKKYSAEKALIFSTNNIGEKFDVDKLKYKDYADAHLICPEEDFEVSFVDSITILPDMKTIKTGNLGFCAQNPLEIEHYKNDNKDYFYIVDGINNLKTFIIENDEICCSNDNLEYTATISGDERISVKKIESSSGKFFAGVIVYCFCYVTKQGHKTGIIDITDVCPITNYNKEQGLAPNTKSNIAFNVSVKNLSNNFEKVEVYSLFRSTLNGEITTRKVATVDCDSKISISDYNEGELVSYQEVLSRFNNKLIASTITQKNSTLFIGDIKTNNYENLKKLISISSDLKLNSTKDDHLLGNFESPNYYHYGIQLQDNIGNWSPVIYIGCKNNVRSISITKTFINQAIRFGYIAYRIMILDNKRIRNTICAGLMLPTITLEEGKYGSDYYSQYSVDVNDYDIYNQTKRIKKNFDCYDIYSPDIEFDENLVINKDSLYTYNITDCYSYSEIIKMNVAIEGNTGILYNNSSDDLGKSIVFKSIFGDYVLAWIDSISGYQKALQLLYTGNKATNDDISNDKIISSLYDISKYGIKEQPTYYKIYMWQPCGSLTDSENTSVLKYKRISVFQKFMPNHLKLSFLGDSQSGNCNLYLFDKTTNSIPVTNNKVYTGIIDQTIFPNVWSIDETYRDTNIDENGLVFWDDDQIPYADNYSLSTLDRYNYNGQPIEVFEPEKGNSYAIWQYSARTKSINDYDKFIRDDNDKFDIVNKERGIKVWKKTCLAIKAIKNSIYDFDSEIKGKELNDESIKIRVTNKYNRGGAIRITYSTAKHLVFFSKKSINLNYASTIQIVKKNNSSSISDSDIKNGQWIPCSNKSKFKNINSNYTLIPVENNDVYIFTYDCLKTEPISLNDINQVTTVAELDIPSYINPLCRYDNIRNREDYNGVTSEHINKLNMVYNQKNNFFVFGGITNTSATDDNMQNTIMYSDMKLVNEEEDTFVNFSTTNFYTIDSNVDKINKLLTFKDKLICFSDNSIVQILYNEKVVLNTDSVASLSLASTDNISGTQILSDTYGCQNKWSIGIYDNILYFNDDINKKIMAFSEGGFVCLNEKLGIEALNSRLMKHSIWNPCDFQNTKINIDINAKEIHYTGYDIDLSFNPSIGAFISLYSYENVLFMINLEHTTYCFKAFNYNTDIHTLREGDYNYFFGQYQPFSTTVIVNNNSLATKTMTTLEFCSESYTNNIPNDFYTFDHVTLWNDFQENSIPINYRQMGISLLKKKFRIWRVNRLRNGIRTNGNYDMISNPWSYLKLSAEIPNKNKITLHWINLNYKL